MKLEEYLQALKACPDEKLEQELGIIDNYVIFLKADFDSVASDFISSGKRNSQLSRTYTLVPEKVWWECGKPYFPGVSDPKTQNKRTDLWLNDGVVHVQLDHLPEGTENNPSYTTGICLHPYQEKTVPNTHKCRVIAWVIEDVSAYAEKKEFPLCLNVKRKNERGCWGIWKLIYK